MNAMTQLKTLFEAVLTDFKSLTLEEAMYASAQKNCRHIPMRFSANSGNATTKIDIRPARPWRMFSPYCFFLWLLMASALGGCGAISINTMHNEPLPLHNVVTTRASKTLTVDELPNGVFIGIAMSGGGSRAANFSAAVLLELQDLGILQNTAVISSVSGSSLVAAYYGLYGCDTDTKQWQGAALRDQFRTDFELPWLGRWLDPRNIARYWFTNFNRSDIMLQELDSDLFDEKQFKDMCQRKSGMPRILINATSFTTGQQFVFSDEQFKDSLNSRLDTYPVANAVMASSSFPVVFHDITLKDYSIKGNAFPGDERRDETENFEHLIDGGPSDNLGITPLVEIVDTIYKNPQKQPNACFLFVVDAFPHQQLSEDVQKADTRHWYDFFLDTNIATSSDVLLSTRRVDLMQELGIDVTLRDLNPFVQSKKNAPNPIDHCNVWHLTFQRLSAPSFEAVIAEKETDEYRQMLQLREVVNATPTRYKLSGVKGYSPESVQDYLFKAANILIKKDKIKGTDKFIFQDVCEQMGAYLKDLKCKIKEQ